MKKLFTNIVSKVAILSLIALGVAGVVAPNAYAGNTDCTSNGYNISTGKECAKGTGVQDELFKGNNSLFKTVTNVLLFLIGAISVIMLIIGGFKYVVSNGDSAAVTSAKNTILYAVIGIVIALLAYALVNFVVSSFTDTTGGNGDGGRRTAN